MTKSGLANELAAGWYLYCKYADSCDTVCVAPGAEAHCLLAFARRGRKCVRENQGAI
jgi:hypothetical protein